ncbi:hypothetical protein SAMN04488040_1473 [Sulfitobacter marinus]|uniref:Asp/Glu/Hydantoin racemase n=1 Tax=Sulfitobacter marinus TaxID=394264 RepID=A0A1I6RT32_9RHOB|nr:hypothetical protein [Sulfitobacter marinus]SFS67879.1 hypothetical protein SAMN04488040_1473 [Sulfitobacter marinus]
MKITCLHTGQSHVEGFTRLFDAEGWDGAVEHIVRDDLLSRAQAEGTEAVAADVAAVLERFTQADTVLCTCSTLGALVERLGGDNVLRIDRPAMEAAACHRSVMLAICLESTRAPSVALFQDCAKGSVPNVVFCEDAWPYFEAGDTLGFNRSIAQSVGAAMIAAPQTDCIVLAQASMQGAAPYLLDIGLPVLATPPLAVRRAIKVARR